MMTELVCVGLATADLIVQLDRWPVPDGREVVEPFRRAGGGPAATAAVAAARMGRGVAFVGAVGDDPHGTRLREELATAGVDVEGLRRRPGTRTAESVILLDRTTATRSIVHAPGAVLEALEPADEERCRAATWVHVDHAGWPLVGSLDCDRLSVDAGNPIPDLDLEGIGLYAPTAASIRDRYPGTTLGGAVAAALAEGARRVVVTLGAEGAMAAEGRDAWAVGRLDAGPVRSTLGAGDVFHGALLARLLGDASLADALGAANAAAALSCRAIDGRGAIPTTPELDAALRSAPPPRPIDLREE